ncbi:MAG: helix-turn-helix transcriptional regulator [Eubacteriales bacterium]|jgi:transcriptional regulator with XRE-family HTH domain
MYELDFKKIGLEMKRLRTERSITQEKIARDLGCTVAFISNVENNHAKLNLRLVNYYARLCNVSVDSILDAGREDPVRADVKSARDEDLLRVFHQYPDDQQEKIVKLLRYAKKL